MQVLAALLIATLFAGSQAYTCTAPPNSWGAVCTSPIGYAGAPRAYVNYHITVLQSGTSVYCEGLGMASYYQGAKCFWGMHDLGRVNDQYVSTIWDNNNAYPAIRCYGSPLGSVLEWTWTYGIATLTCLSKDSVSKIKEDLGVAQPLDFAEDFSNAPTA